MLTQAQAFLLAQLQSGERAGKELRQALADRGIRWSGPDFYMAMSTLEDAGYVEGWYEQYEMLGQIIKMRWYRLASGGQSALAEHETSRITNQSGLGFA